MMKRALIISAATHFAILLIFWQASLSLSRPVARGYPRLMTATLVAKPAAGPAAVAVAQSAAAESKVIASPAPTSKPVEKKPEPTVVSKTKPEKKSSALKQPAKKQTPPPSSGSSSSTGGRGSALSKTGAETGASGGGLKLDAPDFAYPHYIALIQYRIESNWEAPFTGQGERLATIYFKIRPNGEIVDIQLEQSSGNIVFDQAAKRAVYNANPLPPLPAGSGLQTLGVHFDFVAY